MKKFSRCSMNRSKKKNVKGKKFNWRGGSPSKIKIKINKKMHLKRYLMIKKSSTKKIPMKLFSRHLPKNQTGLKSAFKIIASNIRVCTVPLFMIQKYKSSAFNANKNSSFIYAMDLNSLDSFQKKSSHKMSNKLLLKIAMISAEKWHSALILKWWNY